MKASELRNLLGHIGDDVDLAIPHPAEARRSHGDPRWRLTILWDWLDRHNAVVHRVNAQDLADVDADALADEQARRVRALLEGEAAGWTPDWRERRPHAEPQSLTTGEATRIRELIAQAERRPSEEIAMRLHDIPGPPTPVPITLRRHRRRWRASA